MDGGFFSLRVVVALLAASFQVFAAAPAEEYPTLTDDGAWCWFSDPRAITTAGKTVTGWMTEDGSVEAASLDHKTGEIVKSMLHPRYERDDHNNPAFAVRTDGRIMAFYARHNREGVLHMRTSKAPGDVREWEPEVAIRPSDTAPRHTNLTYVNPFVLPAENNRLFLFYRGHSFKPTLIASDDFGATWSPARVVFSMEGNPTGNRPYAKYFSNGSDTIHMTFTDGHPRNEPTNSVYYVAYRAGSFYKADGTRIGGLEDLPIRPAQADLVYDAKATGARAWVWDIAIDKEGRPVIAYTRLPAETDHRYHYARWNGQKWIDTELCEGGKWFPQTPEGVKEREPHYSGGIVLDPNDPSTAYLSRPVDGVREIERWTTPDGGLTWTSEAVTKGSKTDNIRPFSPLDPERRGPRVLWQQITGRYVHFTDYRCSIKADKLPGR